MKYLDRIEKLLEFTKDKKYHIDFFDSNLIKDQINDFYKLGYWDHILLAYDGSVIIAIRIVAQLPPEQWPIVYIERKINSVMMCSGLKALPMLELKRMIGNKKLFTSFHKEIKDIKETCTPVYETLDIKDSLDYYIEYLGNKDNIPKDFKEFESLEEYDQANAREYRKVYQTLDDSEGFRVFVRSVEKMSIDEDFIPEVPSKDYGAWTTRIYKLLAIRAYFSRVKMDSEQRILYLWRSFIEPHAYDPQTPNPIYYPENSTDTHNFYSSIIDKINYHKNDFPNEIKEHPLFEVALQMRNAEVSTSLGFATAAAVIDEKYNDPVLVWKSLINASYYTSSVPQQLLTAKQAQALCERNGWHDAAEAVARNIEIYNKIDA